MYLKRHDSSHAQIDHRNGSICSQMGLFEQIESRLQLLFHFEQLLRGIQGLGLGLVLRFAFLGGFIGGWPRQRLTSAAPVGVLHDRRSFGLRDRDRRSPTSRREELTEQRMSGANRLWLGSSGNRSRRKPRGAGSTGLVSRRGWRVLGRARASSTTNAWRLGCSFGGRGIHLHGCGRLHRCPSAHLLVLLR